MKKLLFALAIVAAALLPAAALGQSGGTLPAVTTHQASFTITNNCASGVACTFNIYRCAGAASACSTSASVWLLLTTSPISAGTYTDTSVAQGAIYSYVAETLATVGGTPEAAGPSNEVSGTVPLGPAAATLGAVAAQ